MSNPFQYGGVVGEGAFCNRKQELSDLLRAMENGEKFFVYSERRMGKTSLLKLALSQLPSTQFLGAYVDLWPTDGEASFAAAMAKAIAGSTARSADKMLETAKRLFSTLVPSVTLDEEGKPQLTFGTQRLGKGSPELDEVLQAPARIAKERNRKLVIVLDEFQRILEYGSDKVERRLRSSIQTHEGIAYIFLGSSRHLIRKMFLDQSRPLYRAGGHYPLEPIPADDWIPFIMERFNSTGRTLETEQARMLCILTQGHPFYTQHLCHTLWEITEVGAKATEASIEKAMYLLLDRESYAYTALWDSLVLNQQRFLSGLAAEPDAVKVFSSDFLHQYGLRTASNAQRVVQALQERDLIDRHNGSFVILDRFFRIWILRKHGMRGFLLEKTR